MNKKLLIEKLTYTMELQCAMNKHVNENWINKPKKDFNWRASIKAEVGELISSTGYKHWKKEEMDMPNIKMEMIDIYHFWLSQFIREYYLKYNIQECSAMANVLSSRFNEALSDGEFKKYSHALNNKTEHCNRELKYKIIKTVDKFDIANAVSAEKSMKQLVACIAVIFETFDEFYSLYIVKNTLNKFRQDNGYKTGTYIKIWNGSEDNVVAAQIFNTLSKETEIVTIEDLTSELKKYYIKLTTPKKLTDDHGIKINKKPVTKSKIVKVNQLT